MSQKSPVPQAVSFVSQVLKRDNWLDRRARTRKRLCDPHYLIELTARHLARLNARAPERQHNVAGFSSPSFRYCCCSGTVGLLVVVSCCAPKPPPRGRGRGIGRRDRVVSALRTVPPS